MKKKELQKLLDTFDTNKDFIVSDGKLSVKYAGKTFERKVESDAGVSQAIVELQQEVDNYAFTKAFKPSTGKDK